MTTERTVLLAGELVQAHADFLATQLTTAWRISRWTDGDGAQKFADFTAKLVDVHQPGGDFPDGLAINITDSIIRARYRNSWERAEMMTPGEAYEFVFQLYPTSVVFRKGHCIRVDVSSSNWPRFDVNPNTGGPLGLDRNFETARQTIYHQPGRASHIVLPLQ